MSPSPQKHSHFHRISVVFLVVSVAYLSYEIYRFEGYGELFTALNKNLGDNFIFLIGVILLLPFNWLAEAYKWKQVCLHIEKLTLVTALKAVLAGTSTGFVTPNRLGDIVGRMHFLNEDNRKAAISLAAVNSLSQNIAILLPGIPLALLFFMQQKTEIRSGTYLIVLSAFMLLFILGMFMLLLASKHIRNEKLQQYFTGLKNYTIKDISWITAWSVFRFTIFSLQLFFLLRFFDVDLSFTQAFTGIPVTYLLITFTPSFAFSEALIRGSWAVFVIGEFSDNSPGILMAGVGLWFINVILPVLIGNTMIALKKARVNY
ncbi:MAG: lysylphosphatidylglycerol synthase domain-containing protein [Paludibacter sp.]|nr:lysylphosphatidylglycerol synthase domain-containing protein [Paludibacter sp.]